MNPIKKLLVFFMFLTFAAAPVTWANSCESESWCPKMGKGQCDKEKGLDEKFFWKAKKIMHQAEALGLSEEQQEAIRTLKMDTKKNLIRQDAEIEVAKMDIQEMLRAESVDVAAAQKLVDQKYELKKARAKMLVEAYAKLKQSITPEQMAKMKEIHKKKAADETEAEKD